MDGALTACKTADGGPGWISNCHSGDTAKCQAEGKGQCKPVADICPGVWAGTPAAFEGDRKLGDNTDWYGCQYSGDNMTQEPNWDYHTGCCGGFENMTDTSDPGVEIKIFKQK